MGDDGNSMVFDCEDWYVKVWCNQIHFKSRYFGSKDEVDYSYLENAVVIIVVV